MADNNLAPALTPHLPRVDGGVGISSHIMQGMPSHWEKVIGHFEGLQKLRPLTHTATTYTPQCLELLEEFEVCLLL